MHQQRACARSAALDAVLVEAGVATADDYRRTQARAKALIEGVRDTIAVLVRVGHRVQQGAGGCSGTGQRTGTTEGRGYERIIGERKAPNAEKNLSVYEPEVHLIVRGKDGKEVEFGNRLDLE